MPAPAIAAALARIIPAITRLAPAVARVGSKGGSVAARTAIKSSKGIAPAARTTATQAARGAAKPPPLPKSGSSAARVFKTSGASAATPAGGAAKTKAFTPSLDASKSVAAKTRDTIPKSVSASTPTADVAAAMAEKGANSRGFYDPVGRKSAEAAAINPPASPRPSTTPQAAPQMSPTQAWQSAHQSAVKASQESSAAASKASAEASQSAASSVRSSNNAFRTFIENATNAVRQTVTGKNSSGGGIADILAGMGMGGSPPPPPPTGIGGDEPPPEPNKPEGFSIAGLIVGAVAGMVQNPLKAFKPPEGSEAVIGNTNASVGRQMVDAPGDIAKGFFKDYIGTTLSMPGIGGVIAGPVAMTKAAMRAAGMLDRWSQQLLSSMEKLRMFSGAIAHADAQARFRQFQRDAATATATGGSTARLSDAYQDLQDTIQPIKDDVRNVLNRITEFGVRALTTGIKIAEMMWEVQKRINPIAMGVAAMWDIAAREERSKNNATLKDFIENAKAGNWGQNGKQVPPKR